MRIFVGLCAAMLAFMGDVSRAADISQDTVSGMEIISISGEIVAGDDVKFRRIALQLDDAVVALSSGGGALVPALEIGKAIRLKGYATLVANGSTCVSACALIWVAGSKRYLTKSSSIGFHASYRRVGNENQEVGVGNAIVGRYLTLLNLPEKAILFATVSGPESAMWLNPARPDESGIDFTVLDGRSESLSTPRLADTRSQNDEADENSTYWQVKPWIITRHANRCILRVEFDREGGVSNASALNVGYDSASHEGILLVTNEKYGSLVADRKYRIGISFVGGTAVDNGWGILSATGVAPGGNDKGYIFNLNPETLLNDLARNNGVRFMMNGRQIDMFPLDGSAAAVAALRRCDAARRAG